MAAANMTAIINPNTGRPLSYHNLEKCFRRELHVGRTKADLAVTQNLFRHAIGNGPAAVRAAIWWTKARMGWRASGPGDGPKTGGGADQVPDGLDRVKAELRRLVEQRKGNDP